ncbi:hypothetical protein [Paenibacillus abyssi]|uniref:Uncharacterized protein n=1 Tax=Paenibacillus abyssi TaxID=1340531 RepID=A0A917CI24_9BACL|nr:hypothetical protein [Paenibacillus abyssi]GGF88145.1 hypothetical protein GCM10010916_01780 [Paenibacillus abyssi]
MSLFTKKGAEAVTSAQATKEEKVSAHVKFNAGTTLKVRFLSTTDSVEYFAHGLYSPTVPTFAPKVTPERNARGYVTSNPSVWDRAADLLYADAKAESDAKKAEELRRQAGNLKSKPRYLVGFVNLENGEQGFVDLTKKQADGIFAALAKYAKKLDKVAFELSKTGASTNTVVSLTPILDMDEDLTDKERENFVKVAGQPFDFEKFEGFVTMLDEAEQTKNLVIAGFDIARLGLSIGAASNASSTQSDESTPIEDGDEPEMTF